MGVIKHYLGLEYCKPNEAGLESTAGAVGKRLGRLLDGLSEINEWVVASGPLTQELWEFRTALIRKLEADDWQITVPQSKYKVRPPKSAKHRAQLVVKYAEEYKS